MDHASPSDAANLVRAVTYDGTFRVVAVDATTAVQGVLAAQKATGAAARCLGDLVVAAVLYRETMAPDLRVQVILKAKDGKRHAVADTIAGGSVRGLLQGQSGAGAFELGSGAVIQIMRTLHNGEISQGVVEAPADGGVAAALMAYMQTSEQVQSMIAIGTRFNGDRVVRSGGYMVQLLPDVGTGPLAIMAERLEDFRSLDKVLARDDFSPIWLTGELLWGMPFEFTGHSEVRYACWCDRVRVVSAIASLDPAEIRQIAASEEPLEITCDFCGKVYSVAGIELQGLLSQS
jgi:molecular chaperone Hsp33